MNKETRNLPERVCVRKGWIDHLEFQHCGEFGTLLVQRLIYLRLVLAFFWNSHILPHSGFELTPCENK